MSYNNNNLRMKEYKDLTEAFDTFKKNAIEHGQCTMTGDYKRGNKCYKNIMNAIKYIKTHKKNDGFKTMLEDSNTSLRIWAAYALLHIDTKDAIKTLKAIAKNGDNIMAFNAEMTLEEFKKGNI